MRTAFEKFGNECRARGQRGNVLEILPRPGRNVRRVVDQDVDPAVHRDGRRNTLADRLLAVSHVQLQRGSPQASEVLDALRPAGGGNDEITARQQLAHEDLAEPGRAASDEPDELRHVADSLRCKIEKLCTGMNSFSPCVSCVSMG